MTAPAITDEPTGKMIRLRHPDYVGYEFGPDSDNAIKFGPNGQQPPHEAWVRDDHPLLPDLLAAEPSIEVVHASGPAVVYVCPVHPDRQFKTQGSLKAHFDGKGHTAADILAAMGGTPVEVGDPVSQDGVTSSQTLPNPAPKQGRV